LKPKSLTKPINYIEFGVAAGHSFKWWLEQNKNAQSEFYGF
jgi:O-methyltransferase